MLVKFRGRLAMYKKWSGGFEGWEERWSDFKLAKRLNSYMSGRLDDFEKVFAKYLPADLPILEAGCGLGQLVVALSARGYNVEGVDFAENTIQRIRNYSSQLNVRSGDVYHLNAPDEYYGGYISIGIFEHNPEGPIEGLKEVQRVLKSNGVALISVPYLNHRRQKVLNQATHTQDLILPNGLRFYQFYYSSNEFKSFLQTAGLRVIEEYPYAVYSGLTRDFRLGRYLKRHRFYSQGIHRRVLRWCRQSPAWIAWRYAHMLMFICKRES
jgi:2-polyprenyl-3-methyl-5-hydroxy-6-metoxy-1,4-benzoquinol methylase